MADELFDGIISKASYLNESNFDDIDETKGTEIMQKQLVEKLLMQKQLLEKQVGSPQKVPSTWKIQDGQQNTDQYEQLSALLKAGMTIKTSTCNFF